MENRKGEKNSDPCRRRNKSKLCKAKCLQVSKFYIKYSHIFLAAEKLLAMLACEFDIKISGIPYQIHSEPSQASHEIVVPVSSKNITMIEA